MLNKVNLALNFVLIILVAYLFFRLSQVEKNYQAAAGEAVEAARKDSSRLAGAGSAARIVYVNADVLNDQYEFIAAKYEELEKEQMRIESQIERKMRAAEERYRELESQAPTMTPSQLEQAQVELQQLQEDIAQFQEKAANDFREKETKTQEEFFQNIHSFLEEYNRDKQYDYILTYQIGGQILLAHDSLDVTDEVVQGLNAQYRARIEQEKKEK